MDGQQSQRAGYDQAGLRIKYKAPPRSKTYKEQRLMQKHPKKLMRTRIVPKLSSETVGSAQTWKEKHSPACASSRGGTAHPIHSLTDIFKAAQVTGSPGEIQDKRCRSVMVNPMGNFFIRLKGAERNQDGSR